ncbi:microsomal triglyceride transfer protein large subunit isoform X2 [Pogonomyrmex barbatus]|uniref:Microsomal triglyceride transfer protein large subunit isoform X2 n=1 Tax=Pogonomyrmex barbatus TaxID=144034 RepID=A0A6I9WIP6_9HYME|nr:microsomal triglyceride transfer protein large subunit isoform X2 [Pogonomyrmex barbatus]
MRRCQSAYDSRSVTSSSAFAVAGGTKGWEIGNGHRYNLMNTLIFREAAPSKSGGDVGFRLTGELDITALWQDSNDPNIFLLKFELLSPQLWIKSRRAPEPEGFVEHSSKVEEVAEKPFFVVWRHGDVEAVYMDPAESASSANLKRGLASLFQYRTLDDEVRQRDASGLCNVAYVTSGDNVIEKLKTACVHSTLPPPRQHPNPVFAVKLKSYRNSTYVLTQSLLPEHVLDYELHRMTLVSKSDVGTNVVSERMLKQTGSEALSATVVQADSARHAVMLLKPEYKEAQIELQPVSAICPDAGCPTIDQAIEEYREALTTSALGTAKSASAFLKLLPLVRTASPEELHKILKAPRYRQMKMQLLDVFGAASTLPAHQAAMKILRQDETGDETERYLWALSLSPTPHIDVVKDVLKRSEETMQNDKVSETYALAAGAMAWHYGSATMIEKSRVSLELGLETCTSEECKIKFLRGLRNLKSPAAISTLLVHALSDSKAVSVAAWRALLALPREAVTDELKDAARRVFYQIGGPRRDSSARTIALDILLENEPSEQVLRDFVEYLSGNDPAYEVRKYLNQRLEQIAERNARFAEYLSTYANANATINNYHVQAQRGLSTAFTRNFLRSPNVNGSLVTIQEVYSGLLKRGIVDVVLESNEQRQAMFSLGLFASGLGSFVSSQDEGAEADDDVATAGMEIDLLGVGIRPFVFFSGQGELMGHVWSGTASERTPAFQALASLYSHSEYVPLGSGFVAEVDVQGAVSFDLAGQIQLSLWSRNAQSLVEMDAGVMIHGGTRVHTSFVQSKSEFTLAMEPKLELSTDVDFSGPVSLCMRLSQPVTTVKHQVYKIERIPGSRHRLRKTQWSKVHSPGRSYRLNQKNNEMCAKFAFS